MRRPAPHESEAEADNDHESRALDGADEPDEPADNDHESRALDGADEPDDPDNSDHERSALDGSDEADEPDVNEHESRALDFGRNDDHLSRALDFAEGERDVAMLPPGLRIRANAGLIGVSAAMAANPDWPRTELAAAPRRARQRQPSLPLAAADRVALLAAIFWQAFKDLGDELGVKKQRISELLGGMSFSRPSAATLLTCAERKVCRFDTSFIGMVERTAHPLTPFGLKQPAAASAAACLGSPRQRQGLDRVKGVAFVSKGSVASLAPPREVGEERLRARGAATRPRHEYRLRNADGADVVVYAQVPWSTLFDDDNERGAKFDSVVQFVTTDGFRLATLATEPHRIQCRAHTKAPARCGACEFSSEDRFLCPACCRAFHKRVAACPDCRAANDALPRLWFDITGAACQRGLAAAILVDVIGRFVAIHDIAFTQVDRFVDVEREAANIVAASRKISGAARAVTRYAKSQRITGTELRRRPKDGVWAGVYDRRAKLAMTKGDEFFPPDVQGWRAWARVEIRVVRPAARRSTLTEMLDDAADFVDRHFWFDLADVKPLGFEAVWLNLAFTFGAPSSLPPTGGMTSRIRATDRDVAKRARAAQELHMPKRKRRSTLGLRKDAMWASGMDAGVYVQNVLTLQGRRPGHSGAAHERAKRIVRDDLHPALLRVAGRHPELLRQLERGLAVNRTEWVALTAASAPVPRAEQLEVDFGNDE